MKNFLVISNDEIFVKNKIITSNFNDTINIIDAIGKKYKILLFSRYSKKKNSFLTKLNNEIIRINFKSIFFSKNLKKTKIFIISITWRNVVKYFFLSFFKGANSGYLYLRSDGSKEYQSKVGFLGVIFYKLMLYYLKKKLRVISVSKEIYPTKKQLIVQPSELDEDWFLNHKKIHINKPKILYLGRIKIEKGIYSLINLFDKAQIDYQLSIVGGNESIKMNSKICFFKQISKKKDLIKTFDKHNIFILPSFTEGAPKVILESLARLRPVIIFREISHVKLNYKGVFICNRDTKDLEKKIYYIFKNYSKIQKKMKTNILPTKNFFQKKLINILDSHLN